MILVWVWMKVIGIVFYIREIAFYTHPSGTLSKKKLTLHLLNADPDLDPSLYRKRMPTHRHSHLMCRRL